MAELCRAFHVVGEPSGLVRPLFVEDEFPAVPVAVIARGEGTRCWPINAESIKSVRL